MPSTSKNLMAVSLLDTHDRPMRAPALAVLAAAGPSDRGPEPARRPRGPAVAWTGEDGSPEGGSWGWQEEKEKQAPPGAGAGSQPHRPSAHAHPQERGRRSPPELVLPREGASRGGGGGARGGKSWQAALGRAERLSPQAGAAGGAAEGKGRRAEAQPGAVAQASRPKRPPRKPLSAPAQPRLPPEPPAGGGTARGRHGPVSQPHEADRLPAPAPAAVAPGVPPTPTHLPGLAGPAPPPTASSSCAPRQSRVTQRSELLKTLPPKSRRPGEKAAPPGGRWPSWPWLAARQCCSSPRAHGPATSASRDLLHAPLPAPPSTSVPVQPWCPQHTEVTALGGSALSGGRVKGSEVVSAGKNDEARGDGQ
ncbi:skin secretory protein xP2-like [Dasypus novemcinctus]|uniref:skin secretory protein xP2-like n=1 Tax=Dasypus novemcinctus TaxID=9361 RepID=UPI0039C8E0E6